MSLWWFNLESVADAERLELFRMSDAELTAYWHRRRSEEAAGTNDKSWPEMEPVIARLRSDKLTAEDLNIIAEGAGNIGVILKDHTAVCIRNFLGMVRSQAQKHKDDQLEALRQAHREEEAKLAAELAVI